MISIRTITVKVVQEKPRNCSQNESKDDGSVIIYALKGSFSIRSFTISYKWDDKYNVVFKKYPDLRLIHLTNPDSLHRLLPAYDDFDSFFDFSNEGLRYIYSNQLQTLKTAITEHLGRLELARENIEWEARAHQLIPGIINPIKELEAALSTIISENQSTSNDNVSAAKRIQEEINSCKRTLIKPEYQNISSSSNSGDRPDFTGALPKVIQDFSNELNTFKERLNELLATLPISKTHEEESSPALSSAWTKVKTCLLIIIGAIASIGVTLLCGVTGGVALTLYGIGGGFAGGALHYGYSFFRQRPYLSDQEEKARHSRDQQFAQVRSSLNELQSALPSQPKI